MGNASDAEARPYELDLPGGRDRFLARLLDQTLDRRWRSAEDFLESFPPLKLMEALASEAGLRAKVLVATTGVHEKIAVKKSVDSAAEDLQLALDEGITTASDVLDAFPLSERVRHLDAQDLWTFIEESRLWTDAVSEDSKPSARLQFVLEVAIDQGLVTLEEVFDGLTVDEITGCLPAQELREVLAHALRGARGKQALTEARFLEVVPLATLLELLPADHTWDRVVVERVAEPCGFVEAGDGPKSDRVRRGRKSSTEAAPKPPATEASEPSFVEVADADVDVDVDFDEALAGKAAPPAPYEDAPRMRVTAKLVGRDRLPPRHACLSLPNLLSLESMYADLEVAASDDEREVIIRDSFPNENALKTTMLALIELLDPTIDTHEPVIRDADVAALIKVVLFEERLRAEKARRSRPGIASQPRTAPPPSRATAPPPPATPSPPSSLPPPPVSRPAAGPSSLPPPARTSSAPRAAGPSSAPPPRHVIEGLPMLSLDELEEEVVSARRARAH